MNESLFANAYSSMNTCDMETPAQQIASALDIAMKAYDHGKGIGQAALSRLSGVPQPTISRTLKGISIPETSTLTKLVNVLGPDNVVLGKSVLSILELAPPASQLHAESLNERIKRLRIARHLSQEDLASRCGVSRVAVSKWESGDTENLRLDNLVALANEMQIGVMELITGVAGHEVREDRPDYLSTYELTDQEQALLNGYRQLEPAVKTSLLTLIDAAAKQTGKTAPAPAKIVEETTAASQHKIVARLNKTSKDKTREIGH